MGNLKCKHCNDTADVKIEENVFVCSECFKKYPYENCSQILKEQQE